MLTKGLRRAALALLLAAVMVPKGTADDFPTTAAGNRYRDLRSGSGERASPGDVATIAFTGWMDEQGGRGREIYSSRRAGGYPIRFVVGSDRVMPGWNDGVVGMQPGGKRLLWLPPAMAYGNRGVEDAVPPGASLIFLIELLALEKQPLP